MNVRLLKKLRERYAWHWMGPPSSVGDYFGNGYWILVDKKTQFARKLYEWESRFLYPKLTAVHLLLQTIAPDLFDLLHRRHAARGQKRTYKENINAINAIYDRNLDLNFNAWINSNYTKAEFMPGYYIKAGDFNNRYTLENLYEKYLNQLK